VGTVKKSMDTYGSGTIVREPQSGKYRRTRLFLLTLCYSRKSVRLLVWRRVPVSGPSCMSKPFVNSVGVLARQFARRTHHCGHLRSHSQPLFRDEERPLRFDEAKRVGNGFALPASDNVSVVPSVPKMHQNRAGEIAA
jgi:hypothetical protein